MRKNFEKERERFRAEKERRQNSLTTFHGKDGLQLHVRGKCIKDNPSKYGECMHYVFCFSDKTTHQIDIDTQPSGQWTDDRIAQWILNHEADCANSDVLCNHFQSTINKLRRQGQSPYTLKEQNIIIATEPEYVWYFSPTDRRCLGIDMSKCYLSYPCGHPCILDGKKTGMSGVDIFQWFTDIGLPVPDHFSRYKIFN